MGAGLLLAAVAGCVPELGAGGEQDPPGTTDAASDPDAAARVERSTAVAPETGAETAADGPTAAASDRGVAPPVDSGTTDVVVAVNELGYLDKVVPVLFIDVGGKSIPDEPKIDGTVKVVEDHDGSLTGIDKRPLLLGAWVGIEIRGNTSADLYAQKPYGIEIRDVQGQALSVGLFGLPKESDFVLHSCYSDKSCMRNALTYVVGREIGQALGTYFAPRTRWVEVYLDGRYQGLYLLVEKPKKDRFRVVLADPAKDAAMGDLTGGYLFSIEGNRDKMERTWPDSMNPGRFFAYRFPHHLEITPAQKSYLQTSVAGLQTKIAADPRWSEVKKLVDPQSWIDFLVMQEVSNNVDAFYASWYLYKMPDQAGGKFFVGPLWDFDLAYGNVNYNKAYCTTAENASAAMKPFAAMFADSGLRSDKKCRYNELRKPGGPLDVARLEAKIDAFARHIERAKARDQMQWNNIGRYIWPNNYVGTTWQNEVGYLKFWLRRRLGWLDKNLAGSCPTQAAGAAPTPIAPAAPARETVPRAPLQRSSAAVYIPIEGPVPAGQSAFACPN